MLQPEHSAPEWIVEHPHSFLGMVRPVRTAEEKELNLRTIGSVVARYNPIYPRAIAPEAGRVDSASEESARWPATPEEVDTWRRATILRHLDDTLTTARHDRLYRLVRIDLDAYVSEALARWPRMRSTHLADWFSVERAHRRGLRHRYGAPGRLGRYSELVTRLDLTTNDDPIVARLRLDHRITEPGAP
jgi:hypothetical protein